MDKRNSISLYYVHALLQGALRARVDVSKVMSDCGLSSGILSVSCYGGSDRISSERVSTLIRSIWRLMDDEFMGFTDQPCKQGVFAIVAKQMIREQTIGESIRRASLLYSTFRNDIVLQLENTTEGARLIFQPVRPELDTANFLVEFFLLVWHRFASWLVAERLPLKYVSLSYQSPPHVAEYSLLFPCHCRFGETQNALVFESALMDLPIKQGQKELNTFLQNSPTDLLSKPDFQRSFSTQVMNMIVDDTMQFKKLDDLASELNMSPRNLRRVLEKENTSYQQIKQKLRCEKALSLLNDSNRSISEIGLELGFDEASVFSRAFKTWMGLSPRAYRDKHSIGSA